jgi:hydroxymethylpyrimidine pyrophosphatase-like HAD family hydrolase
MDGLADATGHRGLAICANGAVLYDLHTEQVIESHPLAVEAALTVVELLRAALPGVAFAVESESGFRREPGYRNPWDPGDYREASAEELLDGPMIKLLAQHADLDADRFLKLAREVAGEYAEFTHSSRIGLLEISATGVSKATALARFCERRGIDVSEVIAFGDMPNDLPLLAWAGTAYAVANAHPEVLAAVDNHIPANDDDGVAQVLEAVFG